MLKAKLRVLGSARLIRAFKNQGALDNQINAQGATIDTNIQDMKGKQALEQLKQSGWNDRELQALVNSGKLDQIGAQGDIDKDLQALKNSGALDQIKAQGNVDLDPRSVHKATLIYLRLVLRAMSTKTLSR